jgi:cold shock CspA family protein
MMSGKIVSYYPGRAFGFIEVQSGKQYFFHIKNWIADEAPTIGRTVVFEIGPGVTPGKSDQAINVKMVDIEVGMGAAALAGGV